jgi:hypothetical protein
MPRHKTCHDACLGIIHVTGLVRLNQYKSQTPAPRMSPVQPFCIRNDVAANDFFADFCTDMGPYMSLNVCFIGMWTEIHEQERNCMH